MRATRAAAAALATMLAVGIVGIGTPAVAAEHHTVTVRLTTSAGVPIPSTLVRLDGSKDYLKHTDARGVAKFTSVLRGSYKAKASFTDKAKKSHAGSLSVAVKSAAVVATVKIAGLTGIRGTVTLGSRPVAGANVWVAPVPRGSGARATTASDGSYAVVGIEPGKVNVSAYGGATANYFTTYFGGTVRRVDATAVTLTTDAARVANIAVKRSATITGKVVNTHGKPMAGVEVRADNRERAGYGSVTTSASGVYYLHGMPPGTTRLSVVRWAGVDDVGTTSSVTVDVAARTTTTAKTIVAKVGTGSITLTQKGRYPLGTAAARLYDSKGTLVSEIDQCWIEWESDTECTVTGHLAFTGLRSGTYTVTLADSNVGHTVTLKPGEHANLGTLRVPTATTVSGTLTDAAGKPLVRVTVELSDRWGADLNGIDLTDSAGHYAIKGLISGPYTLTAYPGVAYSGYLPTSASFTAVAGKDVTRDLVGGPSTSTVRGVVTHAGKPVRGVHVSISPSDGDSVTTNSKGEYSFSAVAPGAVKVSVWDDYLGGYVDASTTVHVTAGQSVVVPPLALHS